MTSVKSNSTDSLMYAPLGGSDSSIANFEAMYKKSIEEPDAFWLEQSKKYISWFSEPKTVSSGGFLDGDLSFFNEGKLNICYNCIDKHIPTKKDQVAMIWEGDEPDLDLKFTYGDMLKEISRIANVMKAHGVRKGDVVTIYMPMIPELPMVMLACARIGAIHSVVFAGFSAESLRGRIMDGNSKFIFACDEGKRGGKSIPLKNIVDKALHDCPVQNVFVFQRTGASVPMLEGRDVWMHDCLPKVRPVCPCEPMDSEDILFILYTSGSTGKPKGIAHSSAGYLLYSSMTAHHTFDIKDNDVFCCVADCGWITGHSYVVYGPLCNGATTVIFESVPTYPDHYRYWHLVQKHRVTQFYTAPTAIRALMKHDLARLSEYDLSSLRILGSVGEPINPAAWDWYYTNIGMGKCTVVDTYWQTETGGHIGVNLPGVLPMKPGSCGKEFFGIQFAVLDPQSGLEIEGNGVEGVLCIKRPWPSMARTVYGDHDRFLSNYMRPYPGYYFTGDGCRRDADGYYWITGRVDDVINPSGHRLGTAEIESALVACAAVSEAAVIGFPHDLKGEGIGCFVVLKAGFTESAELTVSLKNAVRDAIGPIATPDFIMYTDLPKTRSGKIMRRILRKIAHGEEDSIGDVSTLADPSVVTRLIENFKEIRMK